MMKSEFDNLKDAWQAISESKPSKKLTIEELQALVKRKSNSELATVKRKFVTEGIITLLLSLVFILYVFLVDPQKTLWAGAYVLVVLGVSLLPCRQIMYFKLSNDGDLKHHLIDFIALFDRLVSQYLKMYAFLIPITALGAYLLGFVIGVDLEDLVFTLRLLDVIVAIIIMLVVWLAGYFVLRPYFRFIYGKHIERLKECLIELQELEAVAEE